MERKFHEVIAVEHITGYTSLIKARCVHGGTTVQEESGEINLDQCLTLYMENYCNVPVYVTSSILQTLTTAVAILLTRTLSQPQERRTDASVTVFFLAQELPMNGRVGSW